MTSVVYDLECYPNCFLAGFMPAGSSEITIFEISERTNDAHALWEYLKTVSEMTGFNNFHYDWPMLNAFINGAYTFEQLYDKNQEIFSGGFDDNSHVLWNPSILQIDLFKIWHFDNASRITSLKTLEFNMRSHSIEDLPFPPGTRLEPDQIDVLRFYNAHDIRETAKFAEISKPEIEFRRSIGRKALAQSDAKIGKQYFINALERSGVSCYHSNRKPRQTPRQNGVYFGDTILPWIEGHHPAVVNTLSTLRAKTVDIARGEKFPHTLDLDGLQIHLGLGGIHASVDKQHVSGGYILDLDVTSYYPTLAMAHGFYPEHLGPAFLDCYRNLFAERQKHPKKSPENVSLKLALNAVFGDSNNHYSPFYDPAYLAKITLNGQLLLLKLAEALNNVPGLRIIQINTDGITVQYATPGQADHVAAIVAWWQGYSGLSLESAQYAHMWIRDVNNYVAQYHDGDLKQKGSYNPKPEWWKNHSALIVPKVVSEHFMTGRPIPYLVQSHTDPFDFMLRGKVPRGSRLQLADGTVLQGTNRYYISTAGQRMTKHMPPLECKTEERVSGVHAEGRAEILGGRKAYVCSACGYLTRLKSEAVAHNDEMHSWKVKIVNRFNGDMPTDIDYAWYIAECEKLIVGENT